MGMRTLVMLSGLASAGLGMIPARSGAQAWDTGRNMFGFAQYYPGSGWSSFYHPDFDPEAFFPTTFGLRSLPTTARAAPGGAATPGVVWPTARPAVGRNWLLRWRRPR
jgi:hypothetical protein